LWVIKAVDRAAKRTIAWVLGSRSQKTFKRLYAKVKHLKNCKFYTDGWETFAKVLPKDRHIVGKKHTTAIESDNSNTRHHLGRFTRKTKGGSRSEEMVDISLSLWSALTNPAIFHWFQSTALSIYS
jgi:insertion element IS1 protein InsB